MRLAASILMYISGGFGLLAGLFCLFGAIVTPFVIAAEPEPGPPPWVAAVFYGGAALLAFSVATVQLVGATYTMRAQRYGWCLGAAIAGIVGGAMCCNNIGMMMCVVATIFLALPDVRDEFRMAELD